MIYKGSSPTKKEKNSISFWSEIWPSGLRHQLAKLTFLKEKHRFESYYFRTIDDKKNNKDSEYFCFQISPLWTIFYHFKKTSSLSQRANVSSFLSKKKTKTSSSENFFSKKTKSTGQRFETF